MVDPQRRTLPELCMMLHMEFTGASQDMALSEVRACADHVSERVATWKMHSNHERYLAFDTAVLSLCLATLYEFKEWQTRFPVVAIVTGRSPVSTPSSRPLCPRCAADPHPQDFADPRRCAFPAGTFDPDNWQCASMAIARSLEESHGEAVANGYDQRVVIVILPSGAFAVLGVYKNRGRTEAAVVIHGEKPVRPLTLADIDDLERRGPQGAS